MEYQRRINKVYRCLNEVKSLAGAERGLVISNATIAAATVMQFTTVLWLPVAFCIHCFFVWLFKKDPMSRKIYIRYNGQGDIYDPWPHISTSKNTRPEGFDKLNLC